MTIPGRGEPASGSGAGPRVAPAPGHPGKVLVVGAGAIGGVLGAHLAAGGVPVTVLSPNPAIAAALRASGFRVRGATQVHRAEAPRVLTELDEGPYDLAFLCTPPTGVEAAARTVAPALAEAGAVVCLQNGLCEERVAPIVGPGRVLGAVVAWGASMPEPGLYDRTSRGGFSLGRLSDEPPAPSPPGGAPGGAPSPAPDAALTRAAELLALVGPVKLTPNLRGARWSKLALNSVISTLGTLGGDTLGRLMLKPEVRRLALEIVAEAVAVARAEGVTLEKVSGTLDLGWVALRPDERRAALWAKHAVLLAVGARYRRLRSSMLAAIERGREPPVDFLNGEIVTRAGRHGIATPVNALAQAWVWRLHRRELAAEHATIDALFGATRPG